MQTEPHWWLTKDGDRTCLDLYERHYSAYQYRDGRERRLFCGPGEKLVLRTAAGDAVFVWRKFRDASGQEGVNCAVFRNEGPLRSSLLIEQADAIADHCWPGERHYTYVNPRAVRSTNPGYCFICAGWRRCGQTVRRGLLVLDRIADPRCGPPQGERWEGWTRSNQTASPAFRPQKAVIGRNESHPMRMGTNS